VNIGSCGIEVKVLAVLELIFYELFIMAWQYFKLSRQFRFRDADGQDLTIKLLPEARRKEISAHVIVQTSNTLHIAMICSSLQVEWGCCIANDNLEAHSVAEKHSGILFACVTHSSQSIFRAHRRPPHPSTTCTAYIKQHIYLLS